ncbi:TPA: hypothetical protein DEG21_04725 [Patescibacteria group bacterium]|nr:hypothetical protein [Candidatus Gracilibacteria bacterium]HBY75137.1 hypothetical protein [Candidatus Gracilibacteria bacterium]
MIKYQTQNVDLARGIHYLKIVKLVFQELKNEIIQNIKIIQITEEFIQFYGVLHTIIDGMCDMEAILELISRQVQGLQLEVFETEKL